MRISVCDSDRGSSDLLCEQFIPDPRAVIAVQFRLNSDERPLTHLRFVGVQIRRAELRVEDVARIDACVRHLELDQWLAIGHAIRRRLPELIRHTDTTPAPLARCLLDTR